MGGGQLPPFPQILPGHAHGPKKSSSIVQTYLQLWARPHASVKSQNVFIDHCLKQSVVLFHDVTTSDVTSRLLQRKPWNTFSVVFSSHIVGFSPNLVYIIFPPLHKCRPSRKLIERFFGRFSRHVRLADLKRGVRYPHSKFQNLTWIDWKNKFCATIRQSFWFRNSEGKIIYENGARD